MMSTAITNNEVPIVDALWTLITPLKHDSRAILASRLKESLIVDTQKHAETTTMEMSEAMDFVKTLSTKGKKVVPNDANGIEALVEEKYA